MKTHKTLAPPDRPPERFPALLYIGAADAGPVRFVAIEGSDPPKLRRFTMTAYTGGAMQLDGWPYPVVVDLAGLRVSKQNRPILKDHDRSAIVGHSEQIKLSEQSLEVAGVISGTGPVVDEVVTTSGNGFPWQASIGARAERVVFIPQGKTALANQREFRGPVYIARRSSLGEISFVALGADDNTSARIAAGDSHQGTVEVTTMEFEVWASEQGFAIEGMRDADLGPLKKLHAKSLETSEPPQEPQEPADRPPGNPASGFALEAAAELRRIAAIRKLCGDDYLEIAAKALEEHWTETRAELEVLRASRPKAPVVHTQSPGLSVKTLEAAVCLAVGLPESDVARQYGDQTIAAAYPVRNIGFKELVAECARLEGQDLPRVFGDGLAHIRAGFATMSLPGILENVMNKVLLKSYLQAQIVAFDLCSVGSVSDFKEVSRYRLLGTGGFEKVAADGELKSATLGEEVHRNKADTYGQILYLTREDITNDDLGAFMSIPREMGRCGAALVDDLFFRLLLTNPGSFFSAAGANFQAGVDTAFGPDALTKAKTLFRKQKAGPGSKAKDKKPINIRPETLLVPVELETEAELLMGAAQLMIDASGTPTKIPVDNPHRNRYKVVSAPHLSDSYYTGASAKAWYLFANPQVVSAFELVFLNGRRTPIIERVEAPPNNLGMGFRSYLDVGVREQSAKGAVMMKGEA